MAGSILSGSTRLVKRTARTAETDPKIAAEQIAAALDNGLAASAVIFFCSSAYDLEQLGPALASQFRCPLVGCTSAGQIGPEGFQHDGIVAVGLWSDELRVHPLPIIGLSECKQKIPALREALAAKLKMKGAESYGFLLVDGLSLAEEQVTEALYEGLDHMPIVGGSAGDDLAFEKTYVYVDGCFLRDAAVLSVIETTLPVRALKFQHFEATDQRLVITSADPARRIVYEINGERADQFYANAIGVKVDALNASTFSNHPFVLSIAGEPYVRSPHRRNEDGSLSFLCSMETGMVLSIGRAVDATQTIESSFARVWEQLPNLELVLGCDCILRRLEFEAVDSTKSVGALLAKNRVIGFSTYGEQYNGIHINQTFTGLAIGG
jgi:hypothetical protein